MEQGPKKYLTGFLFAPINNNTILRMTAPWSRGMNPFRCRNACPQWIALSYNGRAL